MVPEYSRSLNDGAMGQERPRSGASSTRDACGNGRSAGRSNESQNPKAAGPNMEAVPKTPAVAQGLIKEKAQALDPKKSLAEDTWPGSPGSLTVETIYGLLNMLHPEPFVGSSNATVKDEHTTVLEGGFVAQSPLSAGRGREEEAETLLNPSYSAASSSSSLPRPDRDATDAQKHKISRIEGNVEDSTRQKLEQEFSSVGMEPVYPVRDNPESAKRDVTTNQPGSSQTSSYDYHAADIPPTSQSISCSQYSTSSRTRHQNEEERVIPPVVRLSFRTSMARGHQKALSQQRNAKKQEAAKKAQAGDQKAAAQKALNFKCSVCMSQLPDPKTYKQHFESKHPKAPLPPELVDVVA
ncbi:hypothetical protein QR680_004071 [Steinernema hermaphroditum]|uniref:Small EDRK-rich factor-like N-terminal domain-containing protein n=1 Tax=Steinernema hermaphroditum TaxID=289476 RepID=A0AA39HMJ8_9BILA|nr:hypothetical protein QR680_004071 [Steinernema hermaphroditum]